MTWEQFPIGCNVLLLSQDARTGEPDPPICAGHNLVTNAANVWVARMMENDPNWKTGITHCEVGTDDTALAPGDTSLGAVTVRKPITRAIRGVNVVQFRTFLPAAEITAHLREVALFGHSTATDATGTGEMFNRALIDFDNAAGTKDLTVVVQVTFG